MYTVRQLKSSEVAQEIVDFLLSENAFEQTWAPGEAGIVKKAVFESLKGGNHAYWYIEDNGKIIGAMGVRENDYKSGGYVMADDYLAVHKTYRRLGIGTMLIKEVEKFVKERNGRFIIIETCDIESYKPARAFFQRNGYKQVGAIPDYYVEGEGRIDYLKKFRS
jgi:ribosomal protein S18 acetylase RimI-like enzyme